jgi:antitoxin (DNA-binding transcriptional repressor) of toxin-antitoxin stability system
VQYPEKLMPIVSASEYSKKVGLYQTVAQREPVIITSHGREETVLIAHRARQPRPDMNIDVFVVACRRGACLSPRSSTGCA